MLIKFEFIIILDVIYKEQIKINDTNKYIY